MNELKLLKKIYSEMDKTTLTKDQLEKVNSLMVISARVIQKSVNITEKVNFINMDVSHEVQ